MNWSEIKFRASSWGNLMTEPVTKADKEAGELSKTCIGELIKIYNMEVYGRKRDITTAAMEKGKLCEEDGITLYSRVEKKLYVKNQEQIENEFFTGHPDIYSGETILKAEEVDDLKISWSLDSFTVKEVEAADKTYVCQLNVYYDLTGAKSGNIVYALVSAPEIILLQEKQKLLWNMPNAATDENPEFLEAWEELQRNMIFEDIDYRERIIKIPVPKDEELIQKIKDKVPKLRQWLHDFHKKRTKHRVSENLLV